MIDCHCHLFAPVVVSNCLSQPRMIEELKMDVVGAADRLEPEQLVRSAQGAGVERCVLLPTAAPEGVVRTNDRFLAHAEAFPSLVTMGTLHPAMDGLQREVERLLTAGFCGVKLSTFSQRFDPRSDETHRMMAMLAREGARQGRRPTVLLDTYVRADRYFGAEQDHLTTPGRLSALVQRNPGVDFIGAHMGGLYAGAEALFRDLEPAENLYLDTSNASRTLERSAFVRMLAHHRGRILFGTDWPWFVHGDEIPLIRALMDEAGFDADEQERVFDGNARHLFELA